MAWFDRLQKQKPNIGQKRCGREAESVHVFLFAVKCS